MTPDEKSMNGMHGMKRSGGVRYQREPSLPLLCVPACINMILTRRGCKAIRQAVIAARLGLVAPQRLADMYPFASISESPREWGVCPATAEERIRDLLRMAVPGLHHSFRRWQEVPAGSHLEFIAEHLAMGNDVAVGFRASDIYDDAEPVGHVALVMEVDGRGELVRLMDPEVGTEDGVVVSWRRLLSGIMAVRDGYWLFGENAALLDAGLAL